MKKYRSILLVLVIAALVATLVPVSFASAKTKTKKMTVYNNAVISGKYAYCSYKAGITRINLKNHKRKVLTKGWDSYSYIHSMRVKGKYIYFVTGTTDDYFQIRRMKKTGGKVKLLASWADRYVIKGKKIYYGDISDYDLGEGPIHYKVMKLNGKNKKSTKVKVKNKYKSTNRRGYKVIKKEFGYYDDSCYPDWGYSYKLKLPKGKAVFVGKQYLHKNGEEW